MKSPLRVLHLEDNDMDAELIQATLEADGLDVICSRVQKRDDFVNAINNDNFDLILADYALPSFNGLAALSLAQAANPDIPFIFVSGELGEERAIETLKQGATDAVTKNRLSRLAPVVRRALREAEVRAMRQQAAEQTTRSQAIIAELSQALTPAEVVEIIVHHGIALLGASMGVVRLLTADREGLELMYSEGYLNAETEKWRVVPLSASSMASEAALSREPIWIESRQAHEARYGVDGPLRPARDFEAIVAIPLIFEDAVLGTLGFGFASPHTFSQAEQDVMLTLARQCAQALERARLFEAESSARAEAQALNRELEARVQERTLQLEKEIAERRLAEEKIRLSEQRLAEAQHIARVGGWHWDVEKNVVSWSDQMYEIYGLNPDTFDGTFEGFLAHVHPDDRDFVRARIEQAFADRQAFSFDHRIVLPNGTLRTLHSQGETIVDQYGTLIAMNGTGQDITERKQIEDELLASREQMRQFTGYLQAAREEERTRISREIHDQFGGSITAIKMDLRQLQKGFNDAAIADRVKRDKLQERMESMASLIDSTAQQIRRIASDLRPGVLDDLGLEAAIEWQLQDFQARSGIRCDLVAHLDEIAVDADSSTALFRVFQETLTNVARHAQATHIEVNLTRHTNDLILQVRDNGRGISEQEVLGSHSLGLLGMRERVRQLSGDLNIKGKPGEGTTIMARIPLHRTGPVQSGFE